MSLSWGGPPVPGGSDTKGLRTRRGPASHPKAAGRGAVVLCVAALLLGGCQGVGGAKQSTRLTVSDVEHLSSQMAASLGAAEVLRGRGASSPRMVITINRVENLTSDLIPRREQWAMMVRVRHAAALVELGREKNFAIVVPIEHVMESGVGQEGDYAELRQPTHEIAATLRSVARSGAYEIGGARTDVYLCDMRMTDLATGEIVWVGSFDVKRSALGASFD